MSQDQNPFGGKNPHGLYVPMSEDEQEVLARLIESKNLMLVIHGWATLENPNIIAGDLRIAIQFQLDFNRPAAPMPLHFLDLELILTNGQSIFRQRMPINPPVEVMAGVFLTFQWDIAIDHMDPAFVKSIKPGAKGLTSRRIDKDTGERSETGTMHLSPEKKRLLHLVDSGAEEVRAEEAAKLAAAEEKSGDDGVGR